MCGSRTTLTLSSSVDRLSLLRATTPRSRPPPRPTRITPLPPLSQFIGVSVQTAWVRRRNEPTAPATPMKPFTTSPFPTLTPHPRLLMLALQNRQTRQPSIELRSGHTKVTLYALHLRLPLLARQSGPLVLGGPFLADGGPLALDGLLLFG